MQVGFSVVAAPALGFTGTVPVNGVVDRNGVPFLPTFAMVHGNSLLNTIQSQTATPAGIVSLYEMASGGFDDTAFHRGWGQATSTRFGLKLTCTGFGPYSIMSEIPDVFFGGFISRQAYISAFRVGGFDITFDQNDYTGDSFVVVLYGGTDVTMEAVLGNGTTVLDVGFPPVGVIFTNPGLGTSASGGSAVGGAIAWAAKNSNQGTSLAVATPSANSRFQTPTEAEYPRTVIGFTSTGITFDANGYRGAAIFIGGDEIQDAAGDFLTNTGLGLQTIDLTIPAYMVYLSSVGAVPLAVPDTTVMEWCLGGTNGTQQFSHWCAESEVSPNVNGARFLSNQAILQFGTPDGLASAITARAEFVSLIGTQLTINWTLNDGVAREVLWFAWGRPSTTPDIPTTNPICLAPLPNPVLIR